MLKPSENEMKLLMALDKETKDSLRKLASIIKKSKLYFSKNAGYGYLCEFYPMNGKPVGFFLTKWNPNYDLIMNFVIREILNHHLEYWFNIQCIEPDEFANMVDIGNTDDFRPFRETDLIIL